jgi:hypothetical protein
MSHDRKAQAEKMVNLKGLAEKALGCIEYNKWGE